MAVTLKALSLCSGIGAMDYDITQAGWQLIGQVEIDDFCRQVLTKHWPDVPRHDDIKTFRGDEFGWPDLVFGGVPCQPFSVAGKRLGTADDRHLWPEMYRIIRAVRPRWVVGEQVTGIINMVLDDILADLEAEGYQGQAFVIPACAVGAPHRRDRVWVVAYAESAGGRTQPGTLGRGSGEALPSEANERWEGEREGQSASLCQDVANTERGGRGQDGQQVGMVGVRAGRTHDAMSPAESDSDVADADEAGRQQQRRAESSKAQHATPQCGGGRAAQLCLGRVFARTAGWMDSFRWPAGPGEAQHAWEPPRLARGVPNRTKRLKALGNAVVWHIPYLFGLAMRLVDEEDAA